MAFAVVAFPSSEFRLVHALVPVHHSVHCLVALGFVAVLDLECLVLGSGQELMGQSRVVVESCSAACVVGHELAGSPVEEQRNQVVVRRLGGLVVVMAWTGPWKDLPCVVGGCAPLFRVVSSMALSLRRESILSLRSSRG